MCEIGGWWEPVVYHGEPSLVFCGHLVGCEAHDGGDVCIHTPDSPHCTAETDEAIVW